MGRVKYTAQLLVDGYNIIGNWSSLRLVRDVDGLEPARDALVEALINYSAFKGLETKLIFDAYAQATDGNQHVVTANVAIHYTDFGQTADSYIEKLCAQCQGKSMSHHQRLIVATSDRAQRLTVMGYGAELMSARQLEADVCSASLGVKRKQRSRQRTSSRHLFNSLDPQAQEKLSRLRYGID